jgi:CubicO group peptidase (beta-lactamase class C family)
LPDGLELVQHVTLRELLSHTTGLAQTFTRDEDRHSHLTIQDRLARIPPPVCDPGMCWSYADGNYVIAQLVLETASGQSLTELFHEELIEPWALHGTELVDPSSQDELPSQYALISDDSGRPTEPHRLFEQALPLYETLVMTASDAAHFADLLFDGEVLDQALLDVMLDTTVMRDLPCPDQCRLEYGLGVFAYPDLSGRSFVGHDGSSGTIVVHDAARDLTIAILTNGGDQDIGAFLEAVIEAVDDSGA